ncbi:MAG: response regulator [Candidatus Pacebacteria bacterium]|nr:response regulator [Candidatus Paceibacterota bacterium]
MADIKKVLIVEDENSLRMALVDKFTREKFKVVEAKNGREGLELAVSEKPDIILLDLLMPDMDGLTMVDEMQKIEGMDETPIIVLTNSSGTNSVIDVLDHGITDYLIKSDWSIADIVDKVKDKLRI